MAPNLVAEVQVLINNLPWFNIKINEIINNLFAFNVPFS